MLVRTQSRESPPQCQANYVHRAALHFRYTVSFRQTKSMAKAYPGASGMINML